MVGKALAFDQHEGHMTLGLLTLGLGSFVFLDGRWEVCSTVRGAAGGPGASLGESRRRRRLPTRDQREEGSGRWAGSQERPGGQGGRWGVI